MRTRLLSTILALGALAGCADTGLYSAEQPRREADRVALTGEVCSEDPVEARFPVRVILLVDQAAGPLYSDFDPAATRVEPLREFVQAALNAEETELAVIGYGGRPQKVAPAEGDFTRNPGELFNAVTQISLSRGCVGLERCRDYREALRSARTLIEGDLAKSPAGLRVLTQYVVVMVNAGPHQPLALGRVCCPEGDQQCIDDGGDPSADCESQRGAEIVADMRELVASSGAAGLRFHGIQLAAEPDDAVNDQVQDAMEQMVFAGGGVFQRFDASGGFGLRTNELLGLRTVLRAKLLLAANLNARPGPDGPVPDSDADGLSDAEEAAIGTSPTTSDTDADGVSDRVEVFAGFSPTTAEIPTACQNIRVGADQDLDGLTDCDEELLGTEPTLVDSDGDGMPDRLEFLLLTDYITRDAEADSDGDGVTNGDEILLHADPRSTDTRNHLSFGYRYEIEDKGVARELFASRPVRATGVEIVGLSDGTTPGIGVLEYDATNQALRWQDANDSAPEAGPGPFVRVGEGGEFTLTSSSYAPEQGDEGARITVVVDPEGLPPGNSKESIRVIFRERQCLDYTVRNIRLVETLPLDDGTPQGTNQLLLYFAQAPEDRVEVPGPFRLALVPVIYAPPAARFPGDAVLLVEDTEFVRPRFGP